MKQQPSRLKFRKNHKVSFSFFDILDHKNFYPIFGNFALKSVVAGKLTLNKLKLVEKV